MTGQDVDPTMIEETIKRIVSAKLGDGNEQPEPAPAPEKPKSKPDTKKA